MSMYYQSRYPEDVIRTQMAKEGPLKGIKMTKNTAVSFANAALQ